MNALVLGLGNVLLSDEGAGVRAVERLLADCALPANVSALDGGTLGMELLTYFEGMDHLVLLDCVDFDAEPGSLLRLEGDAIRQRTGAQLSPHQTGLGELLALARLQGILPPTVVLWGVQPARLDWGVTLSEAVEGQVPVLARHAADELKALGYALAPAAPT